MTFEAVLVSALFLADLTVPPQPLKSLGLHLVGDVLWCTDCISSEWVSCLITRKYAHLLREASCVVVVVVVRGGGFVSKVY